LGSICRKLGALNTALIVCFVLVAPKAWALSTADKQHLLNRVSFGTAAHPDLQLQSANRSTAVGTLLDSVDTTINTAPPSWLALRKFRNARNKTRRQNRQDLKAWWLQQIHHGQSPVAERIVLFWHNYFATQIDVVPNPRMLWQQQLVLRKHGLGNYRQLLRAMNEDPALLWFLDNHTNHKKRPNENYARELLELYSLGEGQFSESDVKNLARAMTGASVDRETWNYRFYPKRHDKQQKTLLGTSAKLGPNQVIDVILRQPRAAEYLVERLWQEFISPIPDSEAVEELAAVFRAADYELRPLFQALLEHPKFWAEENRLVLVKSPVELLVSGHLVAAKPIAEYPKAVKKLEAMGQDLFQPPDVGGWPVGDEWINSVRLSLRHSYIAGLGQQSKVQHSTDEQLK